MQSASAVSRLLEPQRHQGRFDLCLILSHQVVIAGRYSARTVELSSGASNEDRFGHASLSQPLAGSGDQLEPLPELVPVRIAVHHLVPVISVQQA